MQELSENDILFELREKVLTITLNNPGKLNPISDAMTFAAIERVRAAVTRPDVGAILLTGAGRAFCAGGDIASMGVSDAVGESRPFEESIDHQRARHELPLLLHTVPKVTIAAVNGPAVGAGLGLALSCDLRFASETARFGTAFANVGLCGDFGTTWQLTRLLGESKAKELFFLPDLVDAQEALRVGLVNRVFSGEMFRDGVFALARRIANGPLVSLRWMKENVNLSSMIDFDSMLDREAVTHLRCSQTHDHAEGVTAFLEKRKANFAGR